MSDYAQVTFLLDSKRVSLPTSRFKVVHNNLLTPSDLAIDSVYQVFWSPEPEETQDDVLESNNEIINVDELSESERNRLFKDGPIKGYYNALLLSLSKVEVIESGEIKRELSDSNVLPSGVTRTRAPSATALQVKASKSFKLKSNLGIDSGKGTESKVDKATKSEASKRNLDKLFGECDSPKMYKKKKVVAEDESHANKPKSKKKDSNVVKATKSEASKRNMDQFFDESDSLKKKKNKKEVTAEDQSHANKPKSKKSNSSMDSGKGNESKLAKATKSEASKRNLDKVFNECDSLKKNNNKKVTAEDESHANKPKSKKSNSSMDSGKGNESKLAKATKSEASKRNLDKVFNECDSLKKNNNKKVTAEDESHANKSTCKGSKSGLESRKETKPIDNTVEDSSTENDADYWKKKYMESVKAKEEENIRNHVKEVKSEKGKEVKISEKAKTRKGSKDKEKKKEENAPEKKETEQRAHETETFLLFDQFDEFENEVVSYDDNDVHESSNLAKDNLQDTKFEEERMSEGSGDEEKSSKRPGSAESSSSEDTEGESSESSESSACSDDEIDIQTKRKIAPPGQAGDSIALFHFAERLWGQKELVQRSPTGLPAASKNRKEGYPRMTPKKLKDCEDFLKKRVLEDNPQASNEEVKLRVSKTKYILGQKISSVRKSFRRQGILIPSAKEAHELKKQKRKQEKKNKKQREEH